MDAIIDLGSNSVRLMLTDKKFEKSTQVTRLAEGLNSGGVLSESAMERTLSAVKSYVEYSKHIGVHNIYIFATEAMRAAKNSDCFIERVFLNTGVKIDILSGNDEAMCGFLGAVSGQSNISKTIGIIDIGGASTEISIGKTDCKNELTYSKSLAIGTVRLRDMFGEGLQSSNEYIKKTIKAYGDLKADSFIGIGGTFTSLSAMLLNLKEYNSQVVDNSTISLKKLKKLTDEIWTKDDNQILMSYPVLGFERAKVIKYGAILAKSIMQMLETNVVAVSETDNLEGYCILKKIPLVF